MSMMMWSIKERRRETSILTAYYDVPFTAIALIFLMSCSPGKFICCYCLKLAIFEVEKVILCIAILVCIFLL